MSQEEDTRMERVLLFGDDGSAGADAAWGWIDAQRWPGWRVEVLTAEPSLTGAPDEAEGAEPDRPDSEPRRSPSPSSGIASLRHLREGSDPRVALLRSDADLIVVGPRGGGLLKMLHLGSTAEFLLHHPPAPLVIARSPRRAERVLVCADGSSHAALAVVALAAMPWIDAAKVSVLGVEDGRSEVDRGIEESVERLGGAAGDVSERRARGPVSWTILEQAEEMQADLIVMGTRGTLGLRRLVVGSTASAVTRAADGAVLVACADEP